MTFVPLVADCSWCTAWGWHRAVYHFMRLRQASVVDGHVQFTPHTHAFLLLLIHGTPHHILATCSHPDPGGVVGCCVDESLNQQLLLLWYPLMPEGQPSFWRRPPTNSSDCWPKELSCSFVFLSHSQRNWNYFPVPPGKSAEIRDQHTPSDESSQQF